MHKGSNSLGTFHKDFILFDQGLWVFKVSPLQLYFSLIGSKLEVSKGRLLPINHISWFWLCQVNQDWNMRWILSEQITYISLY